MTVEDVKKLKTGDVVMCNSRKLRVEYVGETVSSHGFWKFYDYYTATPYTQIIVDYGPRFN